MEQKDVIRKVRLKREADRRALDSAFRNAYRLAQNMVDGEGDSRRGTWSDMSDYAWRRARKLCVACGIIGKRGDLLVKNPLKIREILEKEYTTQCEQVDRLNPPDYLNRPIKRREKVDPFIPRNEMGVIHLFSMTPSRLRIVDIGTRFPDAIMVDDKGEEWSVEFEFRLSSFMRHGHNPTECDLVICWEIDTEDCPLPAIALSKPGWTKFLPKRANAIDVEKWIESRDPNVFDRVEIESMIEKQGNRRPLAVRPDPRSADESLVDIPIIDSGRNEIDTSIDRPRVGQRPPPPRPTRLVKSLIDTIRGNIS